MDNYIAKIGLGTVQWGLNYGVSNQYGLTPANEVKKLLNYSKSCGISTIDTAPGYGDSEKVIGINDTSAFHLCTKVPSMKVLDVGIEVEKYFQSSVEASLSNLRIDRFEYLLLHDCDDLLGPHRARLVSLMKQCKDSGIVNKIGFSAYTSRQISGALEVIKPDVVQIPFSVFDQRLLFDGTLNQLKSLGIEIHARSIFLQGLLLMDPNKLDNYFQSFMPSILKWHQACKELQLLPLDLALYFAASQPFIDKFIIGISTVQQLKEIVSSLKVDRPDISTQSFSELAHNSDKLVNPSLWALKS